MSSKEVKDQVRDSVEHAFDQVHKIADAVTSPLAPLDGAIHGTLLGIHNWLLDVHPEDKNGSKPPGPPHCQPQPPPNYLWWPPPSPNYPSQPPPNYPWWPPPSPNCPPQPYPVYPYGYNSSQNGDHNYNFGQANIHDNKINAENNNKFLPQPPPNYPPQPPPYYSPQPYGYPYHSSQTGNHNNNFGQANIHDNKINAENSK